jgi:DNA mismatch repair protein MutL
MCMRSCINPAHLAERRVADVSLESQDIIQVMPEALANKIAAGEVVQRPSSAAKELIENAVDAGADQITLVVQAAGSELIQVIDNGCGMSPADAANSFKRHATSKIKSIEDLERIYTLGFRGEALASIASVAQVELKTKRVSDPHGTRIRVEGSHVLAQEPCATPDGTSVAVRNLFYNVPARRNFLKTPATEFKHLVDTFQFLALCYPHIGFRLIHDDTEIYRLEAATSGSFHDQLRHRVWEFWGRSVAEDLLETEESTSYLTVRGLLSKPSFHRRNRGEQFLFVNGRYVRSRYLDHAVMAAYDQTLPEGAFPFFVLFLEMDPRHVDVNVHPTKAEVKFDDERGIYGMLRTVVKKTLGMADLTPQFDNNFGPNLRAVETPRPATFAPSPHRFPADDENADDLRQTGSARRSPGNYSDRTFASPLHREMAGQFPGDVSGMLYGLPQADASPAIPSGVFPDTATEGPDDTNSLIWQLHDRFILTQIRSGLMVLDQNAAHQRILYEKALQMMQTGFGLSQQLLFPHTLDFSPADIDLLRELQPDLKALGFDLEFFSGRSVAVRGVPADIRTGNERTILEEILEQFRSNQDALQIKARDNLARSMARRSAIPPGTRLSSKEMRALIDQLFLCEMPYACPAGRPTMIKLSLDELEKRFDRK